LIANAICNAEVTNLCGIASLGNGRGNRLPLLIDEISAAGFVSEARENLCVEPLLDAGIETVNGC
jgi:hypothetical protein